MSEEDKMEQLGYMMSTIKSSFEFVDYVFRIQNVSRAFTHQLVRTRTASYQQEAMRVVDARDSGYIETSDHPSYKAAADFSFQCYGDMIDDGVDVQDARGILPTAVHTNIFVKANLRTLSQMAELRFCKRAEGEYQNVFKEMVKAVLAIHPWAEPLLKVHCVKYGVCAFPRYKDCPVQRHCTDPSLMQATIENAWSESNHVAAPKADSKGFTM
jgi:thymidylate synthase ThyX